METIIYSKFSNERNKFLAIRTDILQDEFGKRSVRKVPLYEDGNTHVQQILKWEKELQKKYSNTCIRLNRASQDGKSIRFEYIEGKTLENVLDELYLNEKYEDLLEVFKSYIDIIRNANGNKKFNLTEDFKKIFGDFVINKELVAADINNLDMVVSNIIVQNDIWNLIDYEWTFEFPIPVNFIIFRIIHYYVYETEKRKKLQKLGFFELFGITENEQKIYAEMEVNFQRYVIEGMTPISNLYNSISKGSIKLDDILQQKKELEEEKRVKIYFDYGNGFSENDSQWVYEKDKENGIKRITVGVKNGTKGLRIDPAEHACLVRMERIVGKADCLYEMDYETNGAKVGEEVYLFDDADPWFCVRNLREGTREFYFDFVKELLDTDFAEELRINADKRKLEREVYCQRHEDELKEKEESLALMQQHISNLEQRVLLESQYTGEQRRRADELEKCNADLNHRLYMAEASFHEIQGSFCWKITKPIRIVGMGIRAFFRRHYFVKGFLRNIKRFLTMGPKKMKQFNAKERIAKRSFHIYDEISVTCDMNELEEQRNVVFSDAKKFSVVVPLYNTPELYLRKMIESVLYQTYDNLELCMADGSDKAHRYVKDICKEYRYYDKRIKYKKLKKNMGISENTNACLEMATGDYITLFDHDDFLHPSALYENMKAIESEKADFIYTDENTFHDTINDAFCPHFKPDYSPDYLRSINYICHLTSFSHDLYLKVGGFRKEFDGSQDYDMILRLTEQAKRIVHIPKVLYYWRAHEQSVAMDVRAKRYCLDAAKKALIEHLNRLNLKGTVEDGTYKSSYRIKYDIIGKPLISILIPNKDHVEDLTRCINSIFEKSTYDNYEIIIIENNSEGKEIFQYYKEIQQKPNVRVVTWEYDFNYSAINNYGAEFAGGEYILLLNNDTEVISPDWIQEMLMYAQRPDVGAVGAKLYYPNNTVQHAGVIVGLGGVAGHSHKCFERTAMGYFVRLIVPQNLSAVTAACLLVRKDIFIQIGGLNTAYKVAFNDVDFCMRIRKAGYLIVFTPYAELYHYESISRGFEDTPEKQERFKGEVLRFQNDWKEELQEGDPYYNPNLSLDYEDFREKSED